MRGFTTTAGLVAGWEGMWGRGLQPGQAFDCKQCEPAFKALLKTDLAGGGGRSALVPGCGRGYAVAELVQAGYATTGLEVAPTAVAAATKHLAGVEGTWSILEADFFTHNPPTKYDVIYDCTFLCAIPPDARNAWAETMAELLAENGTLVTLIFPVREGDPAGGPPYSMSPALVRSLLEPKGFSATSLTEVPAEQLARGSFAKEYLGIWKKV